LSQDRFLEAGEAFERSLALNPKNVIARDNYAKLLYRRGGYSASIEQYFILLDTLFSSKKSELKELLGQEFNESELVDIFRNLSSAYFALGYFDEAVCYSELARQRLPDAFQVSLHSRLLMSLGRNEEAFNVMNETIVVTRANVPSFMLADFGILLLERGEYSRAQESFNRALSSARLSRQEREAAWLGAIYAGIRQEKTKEVKLLAKQLLTTQDQLCEEGTIVEQSYWPLGFRDNLIIAKKEVCRT
jgi:tetratricopeptide (TPR) repeat protein